MNDHAIILEFVRRVFRIHKHVDLSVAFLLQLLGFSHYTVSSCDLQDFHELHLQSKKSHSYLDDFDFMVFQVAISHFSQQVKNNHFWHVTYVLFPAPSQKITAFDPLKLRGSKARWLQSLDVAPQCFRQSLGAGATDAAALQQWRSGPRAAWVAKKWLVWLKKWLEISGDHDQNGKIWMSLAWSQVFWWGFVQKDWEKCHMSILVDWM